MQALIVCAGLSIFSCAGGNAGSGFLIHVYAVASSNGKVYEIDDAKLTASSAALVSTTQNATGDLVFHGGKGYLAVSNYSNTAPGLYCFDPMKPAAGTSRVGVAISGAYILFINDSLAYVTSADYGSLANALYSFNPSSPSSGLTKVVDLSYPQGLALGLDGRIYVAENTTGKVARLKADRSGIDVEIACTKGGATGLLSGMYKGTAGIFVANTGDYATGSIDFIANTGNSAVAVVDGPVAARMAFLDANTLVETGGYPATTRYVDLTATTSTAVEIKYGTSSFGGGDIRVYGGSAYVPDGTNTVYTFSSTAGPVSAIPVGSSGDMITNVGIDE